MSSHGRRVALARGLASAGLVLAALALPPSASAQGSSVSLDGARAEHDGGKSLLVDIREPEENATGVAPGARLVLMRPLSAKLAALPGSSRPACLKHPEPFTCYF